MSEFFSYVRTMTVDYRILIRNFLSDVPTRTFNLYVPAECIKNIYCTLSCSCVSAIDRLPSNVKRWKFNAFLWPENISSSTVVLFKEPFVNFHKRPSKFDCLKFIDFKVRNDGKRRQRLRPRANRNYHFSNFQFVMFWNFNNKRETGFA